MCEIISCKNVGGTLQVSFDPKNAVFLFLGIHGRKVVNTDEFIDRHIYYVNDVLIHPDYIKYMCAILFVNNQKIMLIILLHIIAKEFLKEQIFHLLNLGKLSNLMRKSQLYACQKQQV